MFSTLAQQLPFVLSLPLFSIKILQAMVTLRGVRSVVCCLSLHALLPAVTAVRSTNQLAQDTRAAFVEGSL